jgi:hypothetical protein
VAVTWPCMSHCGLKAGMSCSMATGTTHHLPSQRRRRGEVLLLHRSNPRVGRPNPRPQCHAKAPLLFLLVTTNQRMAATALPRRHPNPSAAAGSASPPEANPQTLDRAITRGAPPNQAQGKSRREKKKSGAPPPPPIALVSYRAAPPLRLKGLESARNNSARRAMDGRSDCSGGDLFRWVGAASLGSAN